MKGIWVLKPCYLGPWTLRGTLNMKDFSCCLVLGAGLGVLWGGRSYGLLGLWLWLCLGWCVGLGVLLFWRGLGVFEGFGFDV